MSPPASCRHEERGPGNPREDEAHPAEPERNEAAAGQMVFHAHFHVVPRSKDDKLLKLPAGAKEMLKPADAKQMAEKIQANLGAASGGGGGGAGEGGAVVPLLFAAVAVLGGVVAKLLSDGGQLF